MTRVAAWTDSWRQLRWRISRPLGDLFERREPVDLLRDVRLIGAGRPPLQLVCVYRGRNAAIVRELVDSAGPSTDVALWALDDVDPMLAAATVGRGPGLRMDLLNQAVAALPLRDDAWLVVSDDDVHLTHGTPAHAVRLAHLAGLDVSQPTHTRDSIRSWPLNKHERLLLARTTRFVETGPMIVFSPRARRDCLPFDHELGMGWGSETIWGSQLQLQTGLLDGVTMRHVGAIGQAYDTSTLNAQFERHFTDRMVPVGITTLEQWHAVTGSWPVWRRRPPWADAPPAGCSPAAGRLAP